MLKHKSLRVVWGEPAPPSSGGVAIAQFRTWCDKPVAPPAPPEIDILPGARVFPGVLKEQKSDRHWGGQLLLDHEFQLVRGSYSLLGGRQSLPQDVDIGAAAEPLAGDHFFLGSAHRHFGHFLLEGLARVWAWRDFSTRYPEGMCLIYERTCPAFIPELLARCGITRDRMLLMDKPLIVERLHVPTPSMRTHHWIHQNQRRTWLSIATATEGQGLGEKVYLSRRSVMNRHLQNEAEIERVFASAGYRVVEPQKLTIQEQIALAKGARSLAGCVGSQLYLAAFQSDGARNLVLAPSNFYLNDDLLISSVSGSSLSLAFGSAVDFSQIKTKRYWTVPVAAAEALLDSSA